MSRSRYIVGIDLGTTNCALAYVDTKGRERPSADIKVFDVPQLVALGVAGNMGEFIFIGDDVNATADQRVLHRGNGPLVAWDHARRKNNRIALPQHRVAMSTGCDTRQR